MTTPARVVTRVEDLSGRGFPEHHVTMKVAAELLMFATVDAMKQWLRRHPGLVSHHYVRTGWRCERVFTAGECRRISEMRILDRLPGRQPVTDRVIA